MGCYIVNRSLLALQQVILLLALVYGLLASLLNDLVLCRLFHAMTGPARCSLTPALVAEELALLAALFVITWLLREWLAKPAQPAFDSIAQ